MKATTLLLSLTTVAANDSCFFFANDGVCDEKGRSIVAWCEPGTDSTDCDGVKVVPESCGYDGTIQDTYKGSCGPLQHKTDCWLEEDDVCLVRMRMPMPMSMNPVHMCTYMCTRTHTRMHTHI